MEKNSTQLRYLLLISGIILFLTMPNVLSPGDGYGPRAEAANLVMNGQLGFTYEEGKKLQFMDVRGEYLFENDAKQRMFSKWGIIDTIMGIPPALAQKIYAGKVAMEDPSDSYLFFVNLNYILLSLVSIFYLYRITCLYELQERYRLIFVAAVFFSTFLWNYLRSHMHELFQLTLFLGFVRHYLVFLRLSQGDEGQKERWRHLFWAAIWVGLLPMVKPLYLTIMVPAWIFGLVAGPESLNVIGRFRLNLHSNKLRLCKYLYGPTLVLLLLFLLLNYYRFGSPFEAGYSQEGQSAPGEVGFSLMVLAESLPGFLLLPGNANIFLHFPLLLFALFGVRRFARRWPTETSFLSFVVLSNFLVVSCYKTWRGEMTYGPRYLLLFAVVGSLPILETFRLLRENSYHPMARIGKLVIAAATLWSFLMQVSVNTVYNFTPQFHDAYFFEQFQLEDIDRYHIDYLTQGTFVVALLAYKLGVKNTYYPLEVLKRELPDWYHANEAGLEKYFKSEIRINYLVLRPFIGPQDTPPSEE